MAMQSTLETGQTVDDSSNFAGPLGGFNSPSMVRISLPHTAVERCLRCSVCQDPKRAAPYLFTYSKFLTVRYCWKCLSPEDRALVKKLYV
mgnify:CR=1